MLCVQSVLWVCTVHSVWRSVTVHTAALVIRSMDNVNVHLDTLDLVVIQVNLRTLSGRCI